jgi:hypothetical protein
VRRLNLENFRSQTARFKDVRVKELRLPDFKINFRVKNLPVKCFRSKSFEDGGRAVLLGLCMVLAGMASGLLKAHFRPHTAAQDLAEASGIADGMVDDPAELVDFGAAYAPQDGAPQYMHSLIPGGVATVAGFRERVARDAVLKRYMAGCDWSTATVFAVPPVPAPQRPLAYRIGGKILRTRGAVRLFKYEPAIALRCGKNVRWFLERCGNEIFNSEGRHPPLGNVPPTAFEYPAMPPVNPPGAPPLNPPEAPEFPPTPLEAPPVTAWLPPMGPPGAPPATGTTTGTSPGTPIFYPGCCLSGPGGAKHPTTPGQPGASTPEPGTLGMVALAIGLLMGMAWIARRRG